MLLIKNKEITKRKYYISGSFEVGHYSISAETKVSRNLQRIRSKRVESTTEKKIEETVCYSRKQLASALRKSCRTWKYVLRYRKELNKIEKCVRILGKS